MTDLENIRALYDATQSARRAARDAEDAMVAAIKSLPVSDLLGLAFDGPVMRQIVEEREESLAIGTAHGAVFHTPWDGVGKTCCKKTTRNMVVVSRKGRRWCIQCADAI